MNHFELAQSFIERCRRKPRVADLAIAFRQTVETLGFRYFACCSHVDPLRTPRGAVMLHTYPKQWVQVFSELDFQFSDPVFQYASRRLSPFFWDDAAFRSQLTSLQRRILAQAARFGVAHGYTVPIHLPRAASGFLASCSVVPDSAAVETASYCTAQLLACYLFEAANPAANAAASVRRTLTRRERQCLELAAQGKSDWEVSRILGLSERTVHNHIERAKRRLGVTTRVQAIVHALLSWQISFGDVVRARGSDRASR